MASPNTTLRAVRLSMLLSQQELAELLRQATGADEGVDTRTVQRWEAGTTTTPRPSHARALQLVTGLPLEKLGFPTGVDRILIEDGRGGHDLGVRDLGAGVEVPRPAPGNYSGIWISRYEYYSSGRQAAFDNQHAVLVLHVGPHISVRSLPKSNPSSVRMTLEVDGSIVTGNWTEETEIDSYYQGARYHGAIQMMADPTGRRFSGKWVGFGRDGDVNTGPWTLTFRDGSTSRAAIDRHDKPLS